MSSRSMKNGHDHRLSGLSLVRDLHEAQETLHLLGVPRGEPYVVTDICLATDPSSEENVWEDETGRYKMEKVGKAAWNRGDLNQKRLMIEDCNGSWVDWKGAECHYPGSQQVSPFVDARIRGNCARANVDAMMLVNGRVCYRFFKEGGIRLASLMRRPGVVDDSKRAEILVRSRDFKRLPPDVRKSLQSKLKI